MVEHLHGSVLSWGGSYNHYNLLEHHYDNFYHVNYVHDSCVYRGIM